MKSIACCTAALLLATLFSQPAEGQSLLDRLERLIDPSGTPPATDGGATPDSAPDSAPAGSAPAGYAGLVADDANDRGRGVRIVSVKSGGPAETSGLRKNDLITAIDGQAVRSLDEMASALGGRKAGESVRVKLLRGDVALTIPLRLGVKGGGRTSDPAAEGSPRPAEGSAATGVRPQLGVRVSPVNNDTRRRHRLYVFRGAVIESVTPGSPAQRHGLPVGAVIVGVNDRRIDSPDDLIKTLAQCKADDEIEVNYYVGLQLYEKPVKLSPATTVARPETPAADAPASSDTAPEPLPIDPPAIDSTPATEAPPRPGPAAPLDRPEGADSADEAPDGDSSPAAGRPANTDELRREISDLREVMKRLEKRLRELEKRLPEARR